MAIKWIVAENEVKTRLNNYDVTAETTDRSLQTESQTKVNQKAVIFFQETENQTKVSQKAVIFFPHGTLYGSQNRMEDCFI